MKTKIRHVGKSSLSILLVIMMIFSTMLIGVTSVNAATGFTVYFEDTLGWGDSVWVYFFQTNPWNDGNGVNVSSNKKEYAKMISCGTSSGGNTIYSYTQTGSDDIQYIAFAKADQNGYGQFWGTDVSYATKNATFDASKPLWTPDGTTTSLNSCTYNYSGTWSAYPDSSSGGGSGDTGSTTTIYVDKDFAGLYVWSEAVDSNPKAEVLGDWNACQNNLSSKTTTNINGTDCYVVSIDNSAFTSGATEFKMIGTATNGANQTANLTATTDTNVNLTIGKSYVLTADYSSSTYSNIVLVEYTSGGTTDPDYNCPAEVLDGTNVMFYTTTTYDVGTNNKMGVFVKDSDGTFKVYTEANVTSSTSKPAAFNVPKGTYSFTNNYSGWDNTGSATEVQGGYMYDFISGSVSSTTVAASITSNTYDSATGEVTTATDKDLSSNSQPLYVLYYINGAKVGQSAAVASGSAVTKLDLSALTDGTYTVTSVLTDGTIYYTSGSTFDVTVGTAATSYYLVTQRSSSSGGGTQSDVIEKVQSGRYFVNDLGNIFSSSVSQSYASGTFKITTDEFGKGDCIDIAAEDILVSNSKVTATLSTSVDGECWIEVSNPNEYDLKLEFTPDPSNPYKGKVKIWVNEDFIAVTLTSDTPSGAYNSGTAINFEVTAPAPQDLYGNVDTSTEYVLAIFLAYVEDGTYHMPCIGHSDGLFSFTGAGDSKTVSCSYTLPSTSKYLQVAAELLYKSELAYNEDGTINYDKSYDGYNAYGEGRQSNIYGFEVNTDYYVGGRFQIKKADGTIASIGADGAWQTTPNADFKFTETYAGSGVYELNTGMTISELSAAVGSTGETAPYFYIMESADGVTSMADYHTSVNTSVQTLTETSPAEIYADDANYTQNLIFDDTTDTSTATVILVYDYNSDAFYYRTEEASSGTVVWSGAYVEITGAPGDNGFPLPEESIDFTVTASTTSADDYGKEFKLVMYSVTGVMDGVPTESREITKIGESALTYTFSAENTSVSCDFTGTMPVTSYMTSFYAYMVPVNYTDTEYDGEGLKSYYRRNQLDYYSATCTGYALTSDGTTTISMSKDMTTGIFRTDSTVDPSTAFKPVMLIDVSVPASIADDNVATTATVFRYGNSSATASATEALTTATPYNSVASWNMGAQDEWGDYYYDSANGLYSVSGSTPMYVCFNPGTNEIWADDGTGTGEKETREPSIYYLGGRFKKNDGGNVYTLGDSTNDYWQTAPDSNFNFIKVTTPIEDNIYDEYGNVTGTVVTGYKVTYELDTGMTIKELSEAIGTGAYTDPYFYIIESADGVTSDNAYHPAANVDNFEDYPARGISVNIQNTYADSNLKFSNTNGKFDIYTDTITIVFEVDETNGGLKIYYRANADLSNTNSVNANVELTLDPFYDVVFPGTTLNGTVTATPKDETALGTSFRIAVYEFKTLESIQSPATEEHWTSVDRTMKEYRRVYLSDGIYTFNALTDSYTVPFTDILADYSKDKRPNETAWLSYYHAYLVPDGYTEKFSSEYYYGLAPEVYYAMDEGGVGGNGTEIAYIMYTLDGYAVTLDGEAIGGSSINMTETPAGSGIYKSDSAVTGTAPFKVAQQITQQEVVGDISGICPGNSSATGTGNSVALSANSSNADSAVSYWAFSDTDENDVAIFDEGLYSIASGEDAYIYYDATNNTVWAEAVNTNYALVDDGNALVDVNNYADSVKAGYQFVYDSTSGEYTVDVKYDGNGDWFVIGDNNGYFYGTSSSDSEPIEGHTSESSAFDTNIKSFAMRTTKGTYPFYFKTNGTYTVHMKENSDGTLKVWVTKAETKYALIGSAVGKPDATTYAEGVPFNTDGSYQVTITSTGSTNAWFKIVDNLGNTYGAWADIEFSPFTSTSKYGTQSGKDYKFYFDNAGTYNIHYEMTTNTNPMNIWYESVTVEAPTVTGWYLAYNDGTDHWTISDALSTAADTGTIEINSTASTIYFRLVAKLSDGTYYVYSNSDFSLSSGSNSRTLSQDAQVTDTTASTSGIGTQMQYNNADTTKPVKSFTITNSGTTYTVAVTESGSSTPVAGDSKYALASATSQTDLSSLSVAGVFSTTANSTVFELLLNLTPGTYYYYVENGDTTNPSTTKNSDTNPDFFSGGAITVDSPKKEATMYTYGGDFRAIAVTITEAGAYKFTWTYDGSSNNGNLTIEPQFKIATKTTVYAKNGTVYNADATSKFGTTEIVGLTGTEDSNKWYTTYSVDEGTTITIQTTVKAEYFNVGATDEGKGMGYYVAGFVINGETYAATELSGGVFTTEYTVDGTVDKVEITPVYYNRTIEANGDYLQFYFNADGVPSTWYNETYGKTFGAYTFYYKFPGTEDTSAYMQDGNWPGQPMLKDNVTGLYYAYVSKYYYDECSSKVFTVDGEDKTYAFSGLALDNYAQDTVHSTVTGLASGTYVQTFDYDEIEKISAAGMDTIRFQAQYRDTTNNSTTIGATVTNKTPNAPTMTSISDLTTFGNGWDYLYDYNKENITDVYGNVVCSKADADVKKEEDFVRIVCAAPLTMASGVYSVAWYVYKYNSTTGNYEYVTCGDSSSFIGVAADSQDASLAGLPAKISFEKIDNGRIDGRWYYADSTKSKATVNMQVYYKDELGNWVQDTTGVSGTATIDGVTSAELAINKTYTISAKSTDSYVFDHWAMMDASATVPTDLTNAGPNADVKVDKSVTYIAYFVPIAEGSFSISHTAYEGSALGYYYLSVTVNNIDGTQEVIATNSASPVTITDLNPSHDKSITVTLTTRMGGINTFENWYQGSSKGYFIIGPDVEPTVADKTVSYTFEIDVAKLFSTDQTTQLIKSISYYSNITEVSADATLNYVYRNLDGITRTYTATFKLGDTYIENNGYSLNTNEGKILIDKYAPYIDDIYRTCKWSIVDAYTTYSGTTVTVRAVQSTKYFDGYIRTDGTSAYAPFDAVEQGSLLYQDVNAQTFYKAAATCTNAQGAEEDFLYWVVTQNGKYGEAGASVVAYCYYNEFNLRINGDNYYITPVYGTKTESNGLTLTDAEYSREQYTANGKNYDYVYADFTVSYMPENAVMLNTTSNSDYKSGLIVVLDKNTMLNLDANGNATQYDTDIAQTFEVDQTFLDTMANYETSGKLVANGTQAAQAAYKFAFTDNTVYNNKNRFAYYLKFSNTAKNRAYIMKAYYYVQYYVTDETTGEKKLVTEYSEPVYFNFYKIGMGIEDTTV